jgi:6-phosphofructokinase
MSLKVGVLTGGGDCPGLNPAIRGLVYRGLDHGFEFVGLEEGWRGLVEGKTLPLGLNEVQHIINQGGTILGTSRTNPFKKEGYVDRCLATWKDLGLDALVAMGGEDTLGVATRFYTEHGLHIVGVPKTMDNDLSATDFTFGFDTAVTLAMEAAERLVDTGRSHRRIMILEVMGRHAGWITAATGLAQTKAGEGPHILLFPEIPWNEDAFLARVDESVKRYGYCAVGASEGLQDAQGKFLSESGLKDAFGHAQLGGVAPMLANLVQSRLKLKQHWAVADYLQRAARHIASKTDLDQSYAVGKAAVEMAVKGMNSVMPTIVRTSGSPYRWKIGVAKLTDVANVEKKMPRDFITPDGFHITQKCRNYLQPLIAGEAFPPFAKGLPKYVRLKNVAVRKKTRSDFKL